MDEVVFRRFQGEGVEFFLNRDQIASYCGSCKLKDFLYDDINFSCYARKTQEND